MRLLIYNIAYGTGSAGGVKGIFSAHRYLRTSNTVIDSIAGFINQSSADVVGLVEIDTGSFRTGYLDQTSLIAEQLSGYSSCAVKYGLSSIGRKLPILRKQANAFFSKNKPEQIRNYYMPFGFKRLVLEIQLNGIRFFLLHLALQKTTRKAQLEYVKKIVSINPGPMIIGGDFNTFDGDQELDTFIRDLDLYDPNEKNLPTFPSQAPKKKLDFILCSRSIHSISFKIPEVKFSDHLPLILDFELH